MTVILVNNSHCLPITFTFIFYSEMTVIYLRSLSQRIASFLRSYLFQLTLWSLPTSSYPSVPWFQQGLGWILPEEYHVNYFHWFESRHCCNNTLNIHIYKCNNIEHYADSRILCDLFPSYKLRFCIIKPHVFILKYQTTNMIDIFNTPLYFKIAA